MQAHKIWIFSGILLNLIMIVLCFVLSLDVISLKLFVIIWIFLYFQASNRKWNKIICLCLLLIYILVDIFPTIIIYLDSTNTYTYDIHETRGSVDKSTEVVHEPMKTQNSAIFPLFSNSNESFTEKSGDDEASSSKENSFLNDINHSNPNIINTNVYMTDQDDLTTNTQWSWFNFKDPLRRTLFKFIHENLLPHNPEIKGIVDSATPEQELLVFYVRLPKKHLEKRLRQFGDLLNDCHTSNDPKLGSWTVKEIIIFMTSLLGSTNTQFNEFKTFFQNFNKQFYLPIAVRQGLEKYFQILNKINTFHFIKTEEQLINPTNDGIMSNLSLFVDNIKQTDYRKLEKKTESNQNKAVRKNQQFKTAVVKLSFFSDFLWFFLILLRLKYLLSTKNTEDQQIENKDFEKTNNIVIVNSNLEMISAETTTPF